MTLKDAFLAGLLLLLSSCAGGLRADAVVSPSVEKNGFRFETWLVSPTIALPNKTVDYKNSTATLLFSIRITNLTHTVVRFDPFLARLKIAKSSGEELGCGFGITGSLRPPQEADYLIFQPGQSLVLPCLSHLYWTGNNLCLDWPSYHLDHPWNYAGVAAGAYRFSIDYIMPSQTMPIRDDHTGKIIKTLNGFWTGDVTTLPLKFQLGTGS